MKRPVLRNDIIESCKAPEDTSKNPSTDTIIPKNIGNLLSFKTFHISFFFKGVKFYFCSISYFTFSMNFS
jgi:hypothetical protein